MGNVLEKAKQEQVVALGRLGWSLRQIEAATGVRRETAGGYLRSAGIALWAPGGWGLKAPAKAATSVTTLSDGSKPAIEVITGSFGSTPAENSKPANEVITGFLPEATLPGHGGKRPSGASEPYREMIELELSRGRNAMDIWQDLVDKHGLASSMVLAGLSRSGLTSAESSLRPFLRFAGRLMFTPTGSNCEPLCNRRGEFSTGIVRSSQPESTQLFSWPALI